jgi:phage gp46-like protein
MAAIPLNLRVAEGCAPQPVLFWDAIWNAPLGAADWAYADASETQNAGGLSARAAIESAVILALFTDKYCPPDHPLAAYIESDDPRGWWGEGLDVRTDLGESEMGSHLWLLERATATPANQAYAQSFAVEALQSLVVSGLAVRADATAELVAPSRLNLYVALYGRDGAKIYDRRFDDAWAQFGQNGVT